MALTLRAVGGLTTREIADAFYVPEATMAQRISRAKRTLRGRRLDQPGDLAVVLRVLYLVYTAGHAGRVDLAGEAIRLARQLTLATEEPEARGLLALMLLNHARLPARFDSEGRIVTLDRQDRGLWDTREIAEGVRVLQSALADATRPGRYQVEAAIAALHDDAASAEETDWPQILAWYDDLVALTDDPVRQDPAAVLGRAVAVGHVLGAAAGLRETDRLREVIGERHRWHAVRGHLHELDGDLPAAATAYAEAARRATNVAERDHLVRQAARARAATTVERMTLRRMDHVGIMVDDLAAAIEFFLALGLELQGEWSVEDPAVGRIVGLDGVRASVAMLQTPDGNGTGRADRSSTPRRTRATTATRPPMLRVCATSRSRSTTSTPSSPACAPTARSSSARWSASGAPTGSATSAARPGSSSSWPRTSADVSPPPARGNNRLHRPRGRKVAFARRCPTVPQGRRRARGDVPDAGRRNARVASRPGADPAA